MVGEVVAADGTGHLLIHDDAMREPLEDLFLFDQVCIEERESLEGGAGSAIAGDVLPPWRADTLEVVKRRLPTLGLLAEDVPIP